MKEIEDLSKPDASEGNNSRNQRDEPMIDPVDEINPLDAEKNLNPFEKKGIAFRFRSRFKRTGRSIKRTLSKSKNTKDSDFSDERDDDEYSSEDIIFPQEKKSPSSRKRKRGSNLTKALGWIVLLAVVFSLGHLTRPEMIENTRETLKRWTSLALEKVEPLKEKVEEKVTELVEKRSTGTEKPGRKIKYWQAPMTPGFTSDKPGKSPMGMDLVPVYEEEEGFGEGFLINPTVVQNIGVKTEKIKIRTLTREIRTIGILAYDERKVTHIHTKYKGWVEKLYVDFTGQEVKKGDLLAEVYSPELVSTQEELLVAMKYKESLKKSPFTEIGQGAERLFESTKRRLELFDVPEHQIEALIRDKKITKTLHIHSPFRGFVVKKNASQGMFIQPGTSLYTIVDLTNIWVLADVYEYELPWIKIGQEAEMNLSYYPGKKFQGKVTYIDPFMDSKTRTLKVRMEFDNPAWKLKPNMYANVTLKSVIAKKSVAVPEEAVIHSGEKEIVIVQDSSGRFDSRVLTLGVQANGYYQVIKGLRVGENVVTSSSFLLDSESRLRDALKKLQSKKQSPDQKKGMAQMGTTMDKPMGQKQRQKKLPGIVEVHPESLAMQNHGH
ncbi:MAG: efflux RND transporter periplasmic adaptor subunit [Nitrospinae bacterium]|nr:efflux RND transporter periplasmic adaptor subunit [Nitrospinota bacterium]